MSSASTRRRLRPSFRVAASASGGRRRGASTKSVPLADRRNGRFPRTRRRAPGPGPGPPALPAGPRPARPGRGARDRSSALRRADPSPVGRARSPEREPAAADGRPLLWQLRGALATAAAAASALALADDRLLGGGPHAGGLGLGLRELYEQQILASRFVPRRWSWRRRRLLRGRLGLRHLRSGDDVAGEEPSLDLSRTLQSADADEDVVVRLGEFRVGPASKAGEGFFIWSGGGSARGAARWREAMGEGEDDEDRRMEPEPHASRGAAFYATGLRSTRLLSGAGCYFTVMTQRRSSLGKMDPWRRPRGMRI